jgi:PEP-CTERM motif
MLTALLVFMTGLSFADPFVNFAGTSGFQSIQSPSSVTVGTYVLNPSWHLTPETVTIMANGPGGCMPGSCAGVASNLWETFSTAAYATYLMDAPNHVTTTATYYLNGTVMGVTTQIGGPINHPRAPGFEFNKVELSWSTPASYNLTFQSFDAVPEPSSLILLGIGLLTGAALFRKRLLP